MEAIWFTLVVAMITTYVVLDGFDFGAGILHLFVARRDEERRTVLQAIGPLWDGNEVWLLAGGGVLFYAFPRAYSAGFSGFYMPLIIVLWLLVLRGLSIEFRSKEDNPLWRSFWDGAFAFSSILMAIVLGAALGNVIRGVPLDQSGFFTGPLFTNFMPYPDQGVLDWYTVLVGVFALLVLAGHGALFLHWKTAGPVHDRSRAAARPLWMAVVVVGVLTTIATQVLRPELYANLAARPWSWPLAALVAGSLVAVFVLLARGRELPAFLASCAFIASLLIATGAGAYPSLLISTNATVPSMTVYTAKAGQLSLSVGLVWWTIAIVLAVGYFAYLYRLHRGKVEVETGDHAY